MTAHDASLGVEDQMRAMPPLAGDMTGILGDSGKADTSCRSNLHQSQAIDHTHDLHGTDELGVGGEKGGATAHVAFLGVR